MPKPQKGQSASEFLKNLALGGSIGAVSKTIMSPVERVKILMQTMDSNPKVISGEVKPYTGTFVSRYNVHSTVNLESVYEFPSHRSRADFVFALPHVVHYS